MRLTCVWSAATTTHVSKRDRKPYRQTRHPPLTVEEWKDLGRSCAQLQASAEALTRSSWQGAPALLVNLAQVHKVIAEIYNRAEAARLAPRREKPSEKPQGSSEEAGSGVGSSEPLKTAQAEAEA
jgi:hypothetical protein